MRLCKEYKDQADFIIIYLEEAHPTDGWMYPAVTHMIAQPTEMSQRTAAAEELHVELQDTIVRRWVDPSDPASPHMPPIYVDTMDNLASTAFGALPERLAIIGTNTGSVEANVLFLGGKGPEEYSMNECEVALQGILK